MPEIVEDIFAGDCMSMAIGGIGNKGKGRKKKVERQIYSWGWNKYNMLFANKEHAKSNIVTAPLPIKLDQLNLATPEEDDNNTYEIALNLNSHGVDNMAYHLKNNKMDKLHENEKRVDRLRLENFKLKKEKKRLEELLRSRTEEMLEKFLKSENKIQLAEKIDEDRNIRHLNKMIFDTKKELEDAEEVEIANKQRIEELDKEIKSFNNELKKLESLTMDNSKLEILFISI